MNYKWKFVFSSTLLLITTLLSLPTIGNEKAFFKGKVQIKDKDVPFNHIYAWVEPDSFHKEEWDLVLLFTESNQENPQNQLSQPSPVALKVRFSLTSPDSIGHMAQTFLEEETRSISSTSDVIVITSCASNRIEGRAYRWRVGVMGFHVCCSLALENGNGTV